MAGEGSSGDQQPGGEMPSEFEDPFAEAVAEEVLFANAGDSGQPRDGVDKTDDESVELNRVQKLRIHQLKERGRVNIVDDEGNYTPDYSSRIPNSELTPDEVKVGSLLSQVHARNDSNRRYEARGEKHQAQNSGGEHKLKSLADGQARRFSNMRRDVDEKRPDATRFFRLDPERFKDMPAGEFVYLFQDFLNDERDLRQDRQDAYRLQDRAEELDLSGDNLQDFEQLAQMAYYLAELVMFSDDRGRRLEANSSIIDDLDYLSGGKLFDGQGSEADESTRRQAADVVNKVANSRSNGLWYVERDKFLHKYFLGDLRTSQMDQYLAVVGRFKHIVEKRQEAARQAEEDFATKWPNNAAKADEGVR